MILQVNGEKLEVSNNTTISQLVKELGCENQRIALEVNKNIIPKSTHQEFVLNAGDKVEIIKAVGGG